MKPCSGHLSAPGIESWITIQSLQNSRIFAKKKIETSAQYMAIGLGSSPPCLAPRLRSFFEVLNQKSNSLISSIKHYPGTHPADKLHSRQAPKVVPMMRCSRGRKLGLSAPYLPPKTSKDNYSQFCAFLGKSCSIHFQSGIDGTKKSSLLLRRLSILVGPTGLLSPLRALQGT
jgi:hypothetical protein